MELFAKIVNGFEPFEQALNMFVYMSNISHICYVMVRRVPEVIVTDRYKWSRKSKKRHIEHYVTVERSLMIVAIHEDDGIQ